MSMSTYPAIDISVDRWTCSLYEYNLMQPSHRLSLARLLCLVHRGTKGYLWWETGSCGEGPVLSIGSFFVALAERLGTRLNTMIIFELCIYAFQSLSEKVIIIIILPAFTRYQRKCLTVEILDV